LGAGHACLPEVGCGYLTAEIISDVLASAYGGLCLIARCMACNAGSMYEFDKQS
jgi:hypothetical protein